MQAEMSSFHKIDAVLHLLRLGLSSFIATVHTTQCLRAVDR